jgi:hypothetical protein
MTAKKNTNKVYDALAQIRADRTGQNGVEGYQRELMRCMDDIQVLISKTPENDPNFKPLVSKGKAVLLEMKRAGIQVQFN